MSSGFGFFGGFAMTKRELLSGPLAKIERAKHHINELNRQAEAYTSKRPLRVYRSVSGKANKITYVVKCKIPVPAGLALIIGDAVHNLRSALDLLAFALVGHKCPTPSQQRQIQFPFSTSANSLEATINSRHIGRAGKKVVAAIKKLKPYPGGNEMLYAIHDLDMADKHKLIVPTIASGAMMLADLTKLMPEHPGYPDKGVTLVLNAGNRFDFELPRRLGNRQARRATRPVATRERETDFKPASIVCFGEGQSLPYRPVVPSLVSLAQEAEDAISVIADAAA